MENEDENIIEADTWDVARTDGQLHTAYSESIRELLVKCEGIPQDLATILMPAISL